MLADIERTGFLAASEEKRVVTAIDAGGVGRGLQPRAFVGVGLEGVDLGLATEESPAGNLAAASRAAIEHAKRFAGEQRLEERNGDIVHQRLFSVATRRAGLRGIGDRKS